MRSPCQEPRLCPKTHLPALWSPRAPPHHTPATRGSNSSLAANPGRALPGVTPEHTPCADSPGPRRRHAAEAPRGRVSSLLEVEGAFQSGNAQPLFGSHRLTPIGGGKVGVGGRWGGPGLLGLRLQPSPARVSIPTWLRITPPRVWVWVLAGVPVLLLNPVASARQGEVQLRVQPSQAPLETLVPGPRPGEGRGGGEGAAASFPKSGP